MKTTKNYQLNQWEKTDGVLMADFNADNQKIDEAIKNAALGNCRIVTGTYAGTGEYGAAHPNALTFDFEPQLIVLDSATARNYNTIPQIYLLCRGMTSLLTPGASYHNTVVWDKNVVRWYYGSSDNDGPGYQFNAAGREYHYIAIG